jgi:hypothetical protein
MNSNCRQTLAALLEGKERISQSIYENKNYLISQTDWMHI